jgi:hypothetical protein
MRPGVQADPEVALPEMIAHEYDFVIIHAIVSAESYARIGRNGKRCHGNDPSRDGHASSP